MPHGTLVPESPAALLRDLSLHFRALGITRLAGQTGLDRLGIPCVAAIRPNSATVATHQGKGIDEVSAGISAVMEAAEYALAEAPDAPLLNMSAAAAQAAGYTAMGVQHLMPHGWKLDEETKVPWLEGEAIGEHMPVLVPAEAIVLGQAPRQFIGISQSTNGLAAGTSQDGALLHALCELIERDAVCLWGFKSDAAALATAVRQRPSQMPRSMRWSARLRQQASGSISTTRPPLSACRASMRSCPRMDAPTGILTPPPAPAATRWQLSRRGGPLWEAAQTRISIIAGSRDDIAEADYGARLSHDVAILTGPATPGRPAPVGLARATTQFEQLEFVQASLARARLNRIIVVPLGGARLGIQVLRAFVPGLEDRLTNKHWRPGPRATAAMLGFA